MKDAKKMEKNHEVMQRNMMMCFSVSLGLCYTIKVLNAKIITGYFR